MGSEVMLYFLAFGSLGLTAVILIVLLGLWHLRRLDGQRCWEQVLAELGGQWQQSPRVTTYQGNRLSVALGEARVAGGLEGGATIAEAAWIPGDGPSFSVGEGPRRHRRDLRLYLEGFELLDAHFRVTSGAAPPCSTTWPGRASRVRIADRHRPLSTSSAIGLEF